ncbi:MAG: dicarboxylate/amino acid:cation symporter [Desulfovibrio sp.]|nr:dicarboxylate/amino acid:cation symporter [Desulfovibrio sp.]
MAKGKGLGLPAQMGIGMILGIIAGLIAPHVSFDAQWFRPFGQLFINLVRMLVVPLVFATLVAGAASVSDISRLGRVAVKTLIFFFVGTAIATAFGLALADIFHPGLGLSIDIGAAAAKEVEPPSLVNVLMNIVPINPMESMAKGSMLQIIFFAVLMGFSLSICGEKAKVVTDFFNGMAEVMIKMTGMVMLYAPIGVFALMAYTVAAQGLSVLVPLLKLIALMYVGSILLIVIFYFPCLKYSGISPRAFLKGFSEPLMTAFSTCSSAAALSSSLVSVEKMGASRSVSSFAIPLGNTINMDGTAIYMGLVTIFAAEIFGVPMPFTKQVSVLLMALLASIGTIGVPGSGMIMITMIFTQVGIPLEAVAIVAGVDRILDMARTSVNVMGDATAAIFVSKLENDFDPERGATIDD